MLDLKAKLLAAGLVTQEQVKKVEDDEAARKQRAKDAREARDARKQGGPPQARSADHRGERQDRKPGKERGPRPDPNDPLEKEARREHALVEAERWRQRLDQLAVAGKAEQYEAVRGWVLRHRQDSNHISEVAERFHFTKMDGSLSHLTVEPDVRERLAAGDAALVAFMGFNGLEHAVVPKDVALDLQRVKPEWLRSLVGVTDVAPPASESAAPAEPVAPSEAASEPVSDT
jgi:uncharacterized protein YaiL (DUF2058 family)